MPNSIQKPKIEISNNTIVATWEMVIDNGKYLWRKKSLAARLYYPTEFVVERPSPLTSLSDIQVTSTENLNIVSSLVAKLLGVASGLADLLSISIGLEVTSKAFRADGPFKNASDNEWYYQCYFGLKRLPPPKDATVSKQGFTCLIPDMNSLKSTPKLILQVGYLKRNREFVPEYGDTFDWNDYVFPPPKLEDIYDKPLKKTLDDIEQFLHQTIYGLDQHLIELGMIEELNVVIQSRTFTQLAGNSESGEDDDPEQFGNFDDVFEFNDHRVLLLGDPGAGKSTTLAAFAKKLIERRLSDSNAAIPILVRVADWNDEIPLLDWIVQQSGMPSSIRKLIEDGRVVFLLDGLDEIVSIRTFSNVESTIPSTRRNTSISEFTQGLSENEQYSDEERLQSNDLNIKFIDNFNKLLNGNGAIISCRDSVYHRLIEQNKNKLFLNGAVRIRPLDNREVKDYLRKQPELWDVLESDERLLELVRTPLLLRIFSVAFRNLEQEARKLALIEGGNGNLRDAIFREYVVRRCKHELNKNRKRFINYAGSVEKIYEILGELAVVNRKNVIFSSRWDRRKHLQEILDDNAEEFIKLMCDLNILIQTESGEIDFTHRLLEYHFAWKPLMANLADRFPERLRIRKLGEIQDKRAVLPLLDVLDRLSSLNLADAILVLGQLGDETAIPKLVGFLDHREMRVRDAAIQSLGLIGNVKSVNHLIEKLDDTRGGTGYPSETQQVAVWALQQVGEDAVEYLVEALRDERLNVRTEAARTLAFMKDGRAVEGLISVLNDSASRIEVPYPGFISGHVDPTNTLLRVDHDQSKFIHTERDLSMVVFALAAIGEPAIEPLIQLYDNSDDPELKSAVVWALSQIEDHQLIDFFLTSLSSTIEKVRIYSVYGLAANCGLTKEKNSRPMSYLISVVDERPCSSSSLLNVALWALGVIGHPSSIEAVLYYLRHFDDEYVSGKYHAIGGLGLSDNPDVAEHLLIYLNDKDDYVRACTAQAFERLRNVSVVDDLLVSLNDESPQVRRHVVEALGNIGDKRAVQPLLSRFPDSDDYILVYSEALCKLGDKNILTDLRQILDEDNRYHVKRATSELIRKLEAL